MILWDFENQSILLQYESHKVRVEAVVFSCCDTYLISLGGPDDSNIIVWDIKTKEALCGEYHFILEALIEKFKLLYQQQ